MNTSTAAQTAGVTVATIRRWCRYGAIAAAKVAGRWIIEAASLSRRIGLGAKNMTTEYDVNEYTKIRVQFSSFAGEYISTEVINGYERSDRREGATPQEARENLLAWIGRRDGLTDAIEQLAATGLYADLTGHAPAAVDIDECHYCGLNPRTCDCR